MDFCKDQLSWRTNIVYLWDEGCCFDVIVLLLLSYCYLILSMGSAL